MSNSRRGLLAAGLAATVVGAMGVVWTLNADAAELPEVETPVAVAEPVPPALLPWGTKPEPLKLAAAGADSATVAAAGADGAPADKSGSPVPEPEYGPKGDTAPDNVPKSTRILNVPTVPPVPPGLAKAAKGAKAQGPPFYHYVQGTQVADTDGTWANLTIEKPELKDGDYHTLAELAVRSDDGDPDTHTDHVVEVGWHVDRSVNGDSDPHLFVFYWKDGKPQCYNICDFTVKHKTLKPGFTLPYPAQKRIGIQHSSGVWWIAYDSEYLGYFPDKNWEGRYTKGNAAQWFGEVASKTEKPCTAMGNGLPASHGDAARIGSIALTNGPEVKFDLKISDYYSGIVRTDWTFRYGGPGAPKKSKEHPEYTC